MIGRRPCRIASIPWPDVDEQRVRSARILGARDAVSERTGATFVDRSVDDLPEQTRQEVQARLGPDRWAVAYAAGRQTSIDALLQDIDQALERSASL